MRGMRSFLLVSWGLGLFLILGCGGKKIKTTPEEANQALASAQAGYQKLMELNPPQTLEYQARVLLKQAEDLLAQKKFEEAKAKADQARTQAELATQAREQMIEETRKELDQLKAELELMYFPGVTLITLYWDALSYLSPRKKTSATVYDQSGGKPAPIVQEGEEYLPPDYDKAKSSADQLEARIAKEKQLSYVPSRMMTVLATDEDLKRYGWPRIYENVLTDCRLSNVVDTVEPPKQVKFIRMVLCSSKATFYLVENPKTGKQGWIAERYVSQARAESH